MSPDEWTLHPVAGPQYLASLALDKAGNRHERRAQNADEKRRAKAKRKQSSRARKASR